ncbi:MAG: plasmid pRiA4b ORF-3 family protein [Rhodobacteraceae bacterium]|nr:plasmid pRiA4b ORF-3 family protein [Paracoccaceae bacterium]
MSERIAQLRIELQELKPKIWRRVDMPLSSTLEVLHEAIQVTMGWTFSHLWEFEINGRHYGDPSFSGLGDEPEIYDAGNLRLGTVIARGVEQFVYVYDYGDYWCHDVVVENVRDGDREVEYPVLVDGARRCPPEDVGGTYGFMDFLEAVLDPAHEEHREMLEWYGGPFDPEEFDEARARFGMANIAQRRRGVRARI